MAANINTVEPTYKQYYDTKLFEYIAKQLNREPKDTKVVSLGMHPSIASFNGFHSLDAYLSNYPLAYKKRFRKVIANELEKNSNLKKYFDDWGNRCYLFSSEINGNCDYSKFDNIKISQLDIDTNELKLMGCEYIFATTEILNYREIKLTFINYFSTETSFRGVYVYQLT